MTYKSPLPKTRQDVEKARDYINRQMGAVIRYVGEAIVVAAVPAGEDLYNDLSNLISDLNGEVVDKIEGTSLDIQTYISGQIKDLTKLKEKLEKEYGSGNQLSEPISKAIDTLNEIGNSEQLKLLSLFEEAQSYLSVSASSELEKALFGDEQ